MSQSFSGVGIGSQVSITGSFQIPAYPAGTVLPVTVTSTGEFGNGFFQNPQNTVASHGQSSAVYVETSGGACTPVISSVSVNGTAADMIFAGTNGTINISGSCFDSATTASIVGIGVTIARTQFVSAQQLSASYQALVSAAPGNSTLTVTTLNGAATTSVLVVAVILSPTDPGFIPANSVISWETCSVGCRQPYSVSILPSSLMGTVTFQLASSSLPGDSTNHCFTSAGADDPTCADPINSAPDFFFDGSYINTNGTPGMFAAPSNNLQNISTNAAVTYASLWVSSRDFGGNTVVTASVTINGVTTSALDSVTEQAFAQLPIDTNVNGIADTWEGQYVGSLSPGLVRTADNEPNQYGAPAGDGFTTFEEYRGFVTITSNSCVGQANCTGLQRTDPIAKQDIFVIDPNALFETYGNSMIPYVTPFNFHLINSAYGNLLPSSAPKPGARVLNRNGSQSTYPIVITQQSLPPGVFGNSQSLLDDGLSVLIDVSQIQVAAIAYAFPAQVLFAQTITHEIGHKLSLQHYEIINPVDPNLALVQANPSTLSSANYAPSPSYTSLYVWSPVVTLPINSSPQTIKTSNARSGVDDLSGLSAVYSGFLLPASAATAADITVYGVTGGTLPTISAQIRSNVVMQEIMDWALVPLSTMSSLSAWRFDPTLDLPKMCLKLSCDVNGGSGNDFDYVKNQ